MFKLNSYYCARCYGNATGNTEALRPVINRSVTHQIFTFVFVPNKIGRETAPCEHKQWGGGKRQGHQHKLLWCEKVLIFIRGWQLATIDWPQLGSWNKFH